MLRRRPLPVVSRGRAVLFGVLLAAGVGLLLAPLVPAGGEVAPGDLAPRTYTASRDAQYESEPLTQARRDEAARNVPDVLLPPDPAIGQEQGDALATLLNGVRDLRNRNLPVQQQLSEFGNLPASQTFDPAARSNILTLDRTAFEAFARRAADALAAVLTRGVQKGQPAARIDEYLAEEGHNPGTPAEQAALRETLRAFVVPNVEVDENATRQARERARNDVAPVIVTYSRGQVLATEGQLLDGTAIEALRETGAIEEGFDPRRIAGAAILAAGFGLLLAWFAYLMQPFHLDPGRRLFVTGAVIVCAVATVRFVLPAVTPDNDRLYLPYALPVAAAAMVVASFAELPFAAVVAILTGLCAAFAGAVAPDLAGSGFVTSLESLELATSYTAAGLAGAAVVHRAERLGRYLVAALATSAATAMVLGAFWLVGEGASSRHLAYAGMAALAAGFGSAFVALGAFVGLSMLFGVTTRLQLMELAQAGHPLLRRLQDEAPGTYHHSMMVGALGERAADRIGADALLVRAGAYYHDIGKLIQPEYYVENGIDPGDSPHDRLEPATSARIIREHVTNGLELARRHRLPATVRDFIPEHHGTRLVAFFYRRAFQADPTLDPAPFRYAGPRPRSKETAIVMLADSCEAVVRAHQGSSRPAMEELVDGVFAERLAEGQLDDCDLTMRELQEVAASFKVTLRAVYHPRIPYPSPGPEELARVAGGESIAAPASAGPSGDAAS